jgi:CheY-like chemotaxis protein
MARILVVDDEDLVRLTLRQMLEAGGHEVVEAANGRQGVALEAELPFDLVVTDIIMPDQEGIETIVQLRRKNPLLKIVAISGGGRMKNMDFLKIAANVGADATLTKPFSTQELTEVVDRCLAG